jgi:hypothetical protein
MLRELKKVERLFNRLMEQRAHGFPVGGQMIEAPTSHGVYVILDRANRVMDNARVCAPDTGPEGIQ